MKFTVTATDTGTNARAGLLELPRGSVSTPVFMPVGTQATVKGLFPRDVRAVGSEIILANTYHLMLRPGSELVRDFGGVSTFMAWNGPVLTDSGGYQIFSLAENRRIDEQGATFRSHIDGSTVFLSPERAVEIQEHLGSDIMMVLDECPPVTADHDTIAKSLEMTIRWAKRCFAAKKSPEDRQSLFPIVQGGCHLDLRTVSAQACCELNSPGVAIGGVSVGESPDSMRAVVEHTAPLLPRDKPRYLMGVGHPRDLLMGVGAGIDMFDCVLPTRNGRNGQALTADGPMNIKNAMHRNSHRPIEESCDCPACREFTRGYLRHLISAREMLASVLISLHNVRFLHRLMEGARTAIREGRYAAFARDATARYASNAHRDG